MVEKNCGKSFIHAESTPAVCHVANCITVVFVLKFSQIDLTDHKLPPSNTLRVQKLNPVRFDRLDFTPIRTCYELDRLAARTCLLSDVCISAENFARQMPEIN